MIHNLKRNKPILLTLLLGITLIVVGLTNYYSIISKSESESAELEEDEQEQGFDKPKGYYDFYQQISTPINNPTAGYRVNNAYTEFIKATSNSRIALKSAVINRSWISRGPGNVGGRTRSVLVDPDDPTHSTWFASAVSGGIWKTTDAGTNWTNLTDQLPNLATNTLVMAPSNHSTLYAGTGEGYGGVGMVTGNGIYKSTNKGNIWTILESTLAGEAFRFVNKILVDNNNANILLAATNLGIFKSVDGGLSWDTVFNKGYLVQDLAVNPKNTTTVYAGVNNLGIIKSFDFGNTWQIANAGIGTGGRYSVAVSPVDSNYIFTSAEAPSYKTQLYISTNGANNWKLLNDVDQSFINFFGQQGWFNNVILAHPFEKNKVFIGGVNLGMIDFKSVTGISEPQVIRVDTLATAGFMGFVNFGGSYLGGGMSTGLEEGAEITEEDYVSIELRFGPGISQKAHRFIVPVGQGAGVPTNDYTYKDYITVPFQAWDVTNNKQLMLSFRDQEQDGKFNLVEREIDDDISGREYIYVHSIAYSATASSIIAKSGGHFNKMLYFFWPTLPEFKTWNVNEIPTSTVFVKYGTMETQDASTSVLADASRNIDLHVDHHALQYIITDEVNKKFSLLDGNDGGLGFSADEGKTWKQIKNNYVTTQFYGVAKKPGFHEYIGGTQDNGTWQSPVGQTATKQSAYDFRVSGDGFEALWHPTESHRILASSYNNLIKVSNDGGETWRTNTTGIEDGPFVTHLSNSDENPNLVFAVGSKGVYRNTNFCLGRATWRTVPIIEGWTINNTVTSSHNVEVSLANPAIVWAGGGMFDNPDLHMFVSTNFGETFDSVNNFTDREMGYITTIATHPTDDSTAYLLYSIADRPKILRTTDMGQTWTDISGFGLDSSSSNGFPNVLVYSLLVMPYNTNIIWVGTEIGIFESIDNGVSWHYANNGLPAVSVWQMFVRDNTIVVATHGRGIWTSDLIPTGIYTPQIGNVNVQMFPNPTSDKLNFTIESEKSELVELKIYSESGQLMQSNNFQKLAGKYSGNLNFLNFPSGLYVVTLRVANEVYSCRIVRL